MLTLSKCKKDSEYFEELTLKIKIKNLAKEGYKYQPNKENNCTLKLDVLDNLRKDVNLIITKPDKGRGVVILNKTDYINKTKEVLDDETKFKRINDNWFKVILRQEDKLNRLLRSIRNKLPDNICESITITIS